MISRKFISITCAVAVLAWCCNCTPSGVETQPEDETPQKEKEEKEEPAESEYNDFSFIQLSDPQLGFISGETLNFTADSLLLEEMVSQVNRLKPAFVLMTGDMTNTSKQKDQIACYQMIMQKMDKAIPVYTLPGNHDIGGDYSNDRVQAYKDNYGEDHFSFRYEDCCFIGINSPIIKNSNVELENAQYKWLNEELVKANSDKCRLKFIVSHYPFFLASYLEAEDSKNLSQESRDKYWPLFKRQGVCCVMAGHLHYTKFAKYNNIEMVTMGAVGKPLGSGVSGGAVWKVTKEGKYSYKYLSVDEFKNLKNL